MREEGEQLVDFRCIDNGAGVKEGPGKTKGQQRESKDSRKDEGGDSVNKDE